jgi:hypothetical protein
VRDIFDGGVKIQLIGKGVKTSFSNLAQVIYYPNNDDLRTLNRFGVWALETIEVET